jgi:hypothetical protein
MVDHIQQLRTKIRKRERLTAFPDTEELVQLGHWRTDHQG